MAPFTFIEGRDHSSGATIIRVGGLDCAQPDLYLTRYDDNGNSVRIPDADWDFIAHARQDAPHLVAEIRRLRGEIS